MVQVGIVDPGGFLRNCSTRKTSSLRGSFIAAQRKNGKEIHTCHIITAPVLLVDATIQRQKTLQVQTWSVNHAVNSLEETRMAQKAEIVGFGDGQKMQFTYTMEIVRRRAVLL
jgi:hypothetical protein